MSVTIYLPRDAVALGLGANRVARAIVAGATRRGLDITIVRTGSRGLLWLEPMVEVATPEGRIAYGPVTPADVDGLLNAGLATGGVHPLRLGRPEEIPYLARQHRLTFQRCGVVDPVSLDDYRAHGGCRGLEAALKLDAAGIVAQVRDSGLRGRGGAGFPAGIKWNTVMLA
ncbi:MAG: fdh2B, partial [Methylobacterium sp.]|nr:fdh2B [Methylobacterium sp.]